MGRGSQPASTITNTGTQFAQQAGANAGALYGTLAPELLAESANPPGMSPTDSASANTAVQQSAGGSEAAAVGQGALRAARTRNVGGSDAAIGEGVREAGRNASMGALRAQIINSQLKERQRQAGLHGLEGLYGAQLGSETGNLNAATGGVNADTQRRKSSWDWTSILNPIASASGTAAAGYFAGGG